MKSPARCNPHSQQSNVLGFALRRWRILNRVKQNHAAELFGVSQSTISRWESGTQQMEQAERAKIHAVVVARIDAAADAVLAQLVRESPRLVHLVCDNTHVLLACSQAREREFGIAYSELRGRSLRGFATEEIAIEDSRLEQRGWYDIPTPEPVIVETGANNSVFVPILPSVCRWTRLTLSNGAVARLVETL
jgi:transcriptional regulator with XRE-family HTH domain